MICFRNLSVLLLFVFILTCLGTVGCSTVPPEGSGSYIPWSQPEEWEQGGMKGLGF